MLIAYLGSGLPRIGIVQVLVKEGDGLAHEKYREIARQTLEKELNQYVSEDTYIIDDKVIRFTSRSIDYAITWIKIGGSGSGVN